MVIQYLIFYISIGLLMALLLSLLNISTFRTTGKVIGYRFKVGSAEYKKYYAYASTKALLATLLGILILISLIILQVSVIQRKHLAGSSHTLVFGSSLAVFFVLWVFYKVASMSQKINGSKPKNSSNKRSKEDDSWLV